MKRTLILLVCCITALCLSACCSHDWKEATCEEPQICKKCGEIFVNAMGHTYTSATCVDPAVCITCGKKSGDALGHTFVPATYEKPSTCSECGVTVGDKLTSVAEWGFNNLEEMGNALVEIEGYDLSAADNDFVIIDSLYMHLRKYENGYEFYWDVTATEDGFIWGATKSPDKYTVANNDSLAFIDGSFDIYERYTSKYRNNFVVFEYSDYWYIPYSLIDWSRPVETAINEEGETEYRLYLVPRE